LAVLALAKPVKPLPKSEAIAKFGVFLVKETEALPKISIGS